MKKCPHCREQFETQTALNTHIKNRHASSTSTLRRTGGDDGGDGFGAVVDAAVGIATSAIDIDI